jgi:hypothetical protein
MQLRLSRRVIRRLPHPSSRGLFPPIVVVAALAFAFAWPMQITGYNQNAHYALTKALAEGTPYVDGVIGEVGELSTGDSARFDGHLYAVKAPGLAAVTLPVYLAIEAVGMRTTGDPAEAIWTLHLAGSVLPALALLLLVFLFCERSQPGYGLAAATILGVGTLVLPFATLHFAHALSAALGFAAFFVLWRERAGPPRVTAIALGGVLAGLAIVAEYQLWLLAAVLAFYAAARSNPAQRLVAYAAGTVAGLLPLAAFHQWAFGSPLHTPYQDYWREHGVSGRQLTLPKLEHASAYLVDAMGLLVLTPVLVCGLVGLIVLYRRGWRAEALVAGAAALAYGLYFSRLGAFGGLGPPRYLVTVVPFLGIGLAAALRAFPLTTIALSAISAFQMAVMTATGPLAAYDGDWLGRLWEGDVMRTAASLVGVTGWSAMLPFFVAVLVAAVVSLLGSASARVGSRDAWAAAAAIVAWAALALRAHNEFGAAPSARYVLAAVAVVAGFIAVFAFTARVLPRQRAHAAGLGS